MSQVISRLYLLAIITFAFVSCMTDKYFLHIAQRRSGAELIEKTFDPYVKAFEKRSGGKYPPNISVSLQDFTDNNIIGFCLEFFDGTKSIMILRSYWDSASPEQKEVLFWHESGHCVLNLPHDEELGSNGVPSSIMYPIVTDSLVREYKKDKAYFLDKLFKKDK